ncbi:MAG TPA: heavy metal translocating P-type ATPase metal-binding domain-containing protein [Chitinophagaceae bacterium]|nr:heavy metal translocating P-type ATPase metal-binding domain-containing protein [Chitinophagaceae bacterium]
MANCYHCGEACDSGDITAGTRHFYCLGCKIVYEILNESNLYAYYEIDITPGISQKKLGNAAQSRYSYLDDKSFKIFRCDTGQYDDPTPRQ